MIWFVMPFIIGTAGHIDHGKTSLIKALTGQDTDRLKEEKERGISIDLGFAHLDLPDGTRAGVVDVPGHERFIRNMLAGAHGIDLVLFTVAADDGVMPQTQEHLDILHLLGVTRAIFVITKTDLATTARIDEVGAEIELLTHGTSLQGSPVVPFSSATGEGLERLHAQIAQALQEGSVQAPRGCFRLPVDRVFVLQGHGVVVTGTARAGEIRVGDRVRSLPGGQIFRVRSLQVHGQPMTSARWGQRIALNLTGQDKPAIVRGHVICDERLTMTTIRFDATLEIRPSAAAGIKSHQRVRLHLGTAERLAKVVLLGTKEVAAPGERAFCQVVTTEPLLALRGDRFVLRDETARQTLAGGVVLHPWSRPHRRRDPRLRQTLETLQTGDAAAVAALFVDQHDDWAISADQVQQFLDIEADAVREQLRRTPAIRPIAVDGETLFTSAQKWDALRAAVADALRAFHAANPLAPGRDMEELRNRLPARIPPRLFRAAIEQLGAEGALVREGSLLRLPGHAVVLRDDEQRLVARVRALLAAAPMAPPALGQIEQETGISRARLTEVLRVLEREGSIVRVAPELYFLSASIEEMIRGLRQDFADRTDITPAMFRDRFGTSRKYAIPMLEYLDRAGVTVRTGDTRRLKAWQKSPAASG
jgi:selenocysteine-specific elongation factor